MNEFEVQPNRPMDSTSTRKRKKRTINEVDNDDDNNISEMREFLKEACNSLKVIPDEYGIFGEFIASQIRQLKNESMKKKATRQIQQLLFTISDEDDSMSASQIVNNNNPYHTQSLFPPHLQNLPKADDFPHTSFSEYMQL